jgi:hypothetical protein
MAPSNALQFKITLRDVDPPIWRRIVVSDRSSLFDLHVAIQSAMGWKDRHLHMFRFGSAPGRIVEVGIEVDLEVRGRLACIPSWSVDAGTIFGEVGTTAEYEYDFGDRWVHDVTLEAIVPREPKAKYPRCLDGARACPPENCGGPPGYEHLLRVLADPRDPEHQDMILWLGRPFDAEAFDPHAVRFSNPQRRLERWARLHGDEN